jgi:hypothetical protein
MVAAAIDPTSKNNLLSDAVSVKFTTVMAL